MKRAATNACGRCGAAIYAPWRICNSCVAALDGERGGWIWVLVFVVAVSMTMCFTSDGGLR
jgi:hypothetical protein